MAELKLVMPEFVKETVQAALEPLGKLETRVKEAVEKIRQEGAINQVELRKVLDEVLKRVRDARTQIEKSFSDGVAKTLAVLNLPTRDELVALEKKVEKLARDFASLKKSPAGKKAR